MSPKCSWSLFPRLVAIVLQAILLAGLIVLLLAGSGPLKNDTPVYPWGHIALVRVSILMRLSRGAWTLRNLIIDARKLPIDTITDQHRRIHQRHKRRTLPRPPRLPRLLQAKRLLRHLPRVVLQRFEERWQLPRRLLLALGPPALRPAPAVACLGRRPHGEQAGCAGAKEDFHRLRYICCECGIVTASWVACDLLVPMYVAGRCTVMGKQVETLAQHKMD